MKMFRFPLAPVARPGLGLMLLAMAGPAAAHVAVGGPPLRPAPSLGPAFAQYSPVPPRGRVVSDHDHARQRQSENRSFEDLMRSAQARGRGEYLGVEPDIGRNIYRFKFMRPNGSVVWVDVDGRTARVLAERD